MRDAAFVVVAVWVVLLAVRAGAARAALGARRTRSPAADATRQASIGEVTVLVAVRSGDPLLPGLLAESATTTAPARLLLLVDDDDPAGLDAARSAATHGNVEVLTCEPPPPGRNPKVHKLMLAEPRLGPIVVLLDDDTVLPTGGLARLVEGLDAAELVTGLPVYRERGSLWSRLVAAFVNGSAFLTYLPMARFGPPVTVNGMVLATRRESLERVGGFAVIADATCDDYALALAYRSGGLRIGQTAQVAELATTCRRAGDYARLMRRWMLFATQVVRRDPSLRLAVLVVLPAALPLTALTLALVAGSWVAIGAVVAMLAVSALVTRWLRGSAGAPRASGPSGMAALVLEPLASLLSPLFALAAAVGPATVTWRGRRVRVGVGSAARVGVRP